MSDPEDQRPDSLINRDDGRRYWDSVDADDNGMLGGFPQVSDGDILGSRQFLASLGIGGSKKLTRVLEGGFENSIGRITRRLLIPLASAVDVIEPMARFTAALHGVGGVGTIFNVGLEEWRPPGGERYDLVWTQWCVGHLTDEQLVMHLRVCAGALEPREGIIVVKENLAAGADVFDEVDSSVTRQDSTFLSIFESAGLEVVRMEMQEDLKVDDDVALMPVKMYALRPTAQPF